MSWLKSLFFAVCVFSVVASCNNAPEHTDTLSTGSVEISVDETFKPVIEEELKVFDSSYPEAKITIHYEPEAACFKDYFDKKSRLILVTRNLTNDEKTLCDQKKIAPSSVTLAEDAIALIVNKESPDTILGMNEIKGILTGAYNKKYTIVFDNEGSGMIRYITDSLLKGQKLGNNVFAAKSNNEVVDYVAHKHDAIGFVGLNYVSDSADTTNTGAFINKVRVVAIQNDSTGKFYQPYQAYIALKLYPFVRKLYYINEESYPGLGTGFANFLVSDRGQLIFAHAHLFPLKMGIVIREAEVNP